MSVADRSGNSHISHESRVSKTGETCPSREEKYLLFPALSLVHLKGPPALNLLRSLIYPGGGKQGEVKVPWSQAQLCYHDKGLSPR